MSEIISHVSSRRVDFDIEGALRNAGGPMKRKNLLLVFVQSENGFLGVGECWLEPAYSDSIESRLGNWTHQLPGTHPQLALQRMPEWQSEFDDGTDREAMAALSGLDMALWDLTATAHGLPLHQLLARALPPRIRAERAQRVKVYASGGLYHPVTNPNEAVDRLLSEMLPALEQGHDALKVKVGGVPLEQDMQRLAALREAVGEDVHLMADANCALDADRAAQWLEAMRPFDLHWFEEPLPRSEWAGLAKLQRMQAVPLCGNEGETGNDPVSRLLYHRCVDFLQIDLSICGGFTAAIRYLALAELHQVPCTLHAAASAVLHQANTHLAAACRNRPWVESHLLHRWFHGAIKSGEPNVTGGLLKPPSGPGLGLDREQLARG